MGQNRLIDEVQNFHVNADQLCLWWLGQMGFVVKTAGAIVYFDMFLHEHPLRIHESPFAGKDVVFGTLVFGSHDHDDHIDRHEWPDIAANCPGIKFVTPSILVPRLANDLQISESKFIGIDDGREVIYRNIKIDGIAAKHEFFDQDKVTLQYPYMGYLVEIDGFVLFHAGDTCVYDGLVSKLRRKHMDLCILPINGRDAKRFLSDCPGNMTYQEAADLAGEVRPSLTVPGHYDMVHGNLENPQLFCDYFSAKYPELECLIPRHYEPVVMVRDMNGEIRVGQPGSCSWMDMFFE